jgi:DNA repair protein RecN (Recombination protein N)
MLRLIRVNRLAVIDSVEVEFGPGLNVLTGETGAGKSILVEAVSLLLGGRASGDLVRTGEDLATVEAMFETDAGELVVRREISSQGRSRAFVNDALVTAGGLKDLAGGLIELHGQHEHQTLLDPSTHLGVLDRFGQLEARVAAVRDAFLALDSATRALADARRTRADRDAREELVAFQLGELDRAGLQPAEDDELLAVRQVLGNAERVQRLCEESYAALYENDGAVLAQLGGVWRRVADLAALDPQFRPHIVARDGIKSQLEELAHFLRHYADGVDASPARLQAVEERLALLERLKRRYGPSLQDVLARRDALRIELNDLREGGGRISELEQAEAQARERYLEVARGLSAARRRAALEFDRLVQATLADVAMARTQFEVRFERPGAGDVPPQPAWSHDGFDVVEFFVSPNPGEDLRPLARVASGGELSRIMLAIKTLTFRRRLDSPRAGAAAGMPGLIFDEVDAGIGGRVADVIGRKLHDLAGSFQVLCITHLPQIAAYADSHFQVEKVVKAGRTSTTVKPLGTAARVEELARMLGGEVVTDALRRSAAEMLAERTGAPAGEAKEKGESERAKAKGRRGA